MSGTPRDIHRGGSHRGGSARNAQAARTVLFLISDTGAGHRSAANAIIKAMALLEESVAGDRPEGNGRRWKAVVVDAFAECGRFPLRNGISLYGPVTKYSPRLYGRIFRMTNSTERFQMAYRIFLPFLRQGLSELIERLRPDVIVSVHPLLNHPAVLVRRDLGVRIPIITVVTDLFTIHRSWLAEGVDACVVPNEATRQLAIAGGIARKRVHVLGLPIDPAFAHPNARTRAEHRAALGLDPRLPMVLLVGGGEGAGGLATVCRSLSRETLRAQLVVIAGRNRALYTELRDMAAAFQIPIHIEGFVTNMPDWMRAADVIVTKAGPGTITEAIACELPIILMGAVPGQEDGNIEFVVENGLGVLASSPEQVIGHLSSMLYPDDSSLARMHENAQCARYPRAAFDIAQLILSYLPSYKASSIWEHASSLQQGSRLPRPRQLIRIAAIRRARRVIRTYQSRMLRRAIRSRR